MILKITIALAVQMKNMFCCIVNLSYRVHRVPPRKIERRGLNENIYEINVF